MSSVVAALCSDEAALGTAVEAPGGFVGVSNGTVAALGWLVGAPSDLVEALSFDEGAARSRFAAPGSGVGERCRLVGAPSSHEGARNCGFEAFAYAVPVRNLGIVGAGIEGGSLSASEVAPNLNLSVRGTTYYHLLALMVEMRNFVVFTLLHQPGDFAICIAISYQVAVKGIKTAKVGTTRRVVRRRCLRMIHAQPDGPAVRPYPPNTGRIYTLECNVVLHP